MSRARFDYHNICTTGTIRVSREIYNQIKPKLELTIPERQLGSVKHWKITVLFHKLLSTRITIPYLIDYHVTDTIRFLVFLGLNILFGINQNEYTTDYKLYGWLTIANGGLALLLAPRANLFSLLLRIPSNVLLVYHRLIGMATVAHATAHFGFNIMHYISTEQLEDSLANARIRIGIMAWLSLAIIFLTALPIVRRKGFEIFYYSHFLFFVFMVGALIHTTNGPEFLLPGFSLWVVDRIFRLYQSFQKVEIQEITHYKGQVTKFAVKGVTVRHPGQVVWVRLSAVSLLNWHPFTVMRSPGNTSDLATFAVRGLGGYTEKAQYLTTEKGHATTSTENAHALESGLTVRINGPFGVGRLNWKSFPVVALVAGGIGITPAISILSHITTSRAALSEHATGFTQQQIDIYLIWVVKRLDHTAWFKDELGRLAELSAQPNVKVNLKVSIFSTERTKAENLMSQEMTVGGHISEPMPTSWVVRHERPDFSEFFRDLRNLHSGCDIGVSLCGPKSLMRQARKAAVHENSTTGLFYIEDEVFER